MENSKFAKVIITGLAGLSMGGALIAPSVLSQNANAARVTAVAKHNVKRHAKRHGLVTIKGKKYYYNVKGRRLKGWRTIRVHGHKYRVYLSRKNGAMLTGFRKIKAHRYYFSKKTGNMFRGTHKIGSKVYVFSKHGRLMRSYKAPKKNVVKKSAAKTNTFKVAKHNKPVAKKSVAVSKAVKPVKKSVNKVAAPSNAYQPMSKAAAFKKVQAVTAKSKTKLPKTFNGMPFPDFDHSNPSYHMTVKNGYEYIDGVVQHKLIYPVAIKTMKVHDGSMQKVVVFSNGVRITERALKAEPHMLTQDMLDNADKDNILDVSHVFTA